MAEREELFVGVLGWLSHPCVRDAVAEHLSRELELLELSPLPVLPQTLGR